MEHYRSTLGTAAAAVLGLVVAAHVLHPGNFEDQPHPGRAVAARTETAAAMAPATAWVDPPPFALYLRPSATASEMAVLAPRMTAPLPAGLTMAPALPAEMVVATDRPRKAAAPHRPRVAQRATRTRWTMAPRERTAAAAVDGVRPARGDALDAPSHEPARDGEG